MITNLHGALYPASIHRPFTITASLGKVQEKENSIFMFCLVWLNNERKTNLEGKLVVLLFEEKYCI